MGANICNAGQPQNEAQTEFGIYSFKRDVIINIYKGNSFERKGQKVL